MTRTTRAHHPFTYDKVREFDAVLGHGRAARDGVRVPLRSRQYLVDDDDGRELGSLVTWNELFDVNDHDTMQEIAVIYLGEDTWLGHSRIKRVK